MGGQKKIYELHAQRMDQVRQNTHSLFQKLKEYETTGLAYYSGNNESRTLVTNKLCQRTLNDAEKTF